jgi:hypothetical protein
MSGFEKNRDYVGEAVEDQMAKGTHMRRLRALGNILERLPGDARVVSVDTLVPMIQLFGRRDVYRAAKALGERVRREDRGHFCQWGFRVGGVDVLAVGRRDG